MDHRSRRAAPGEDGLRRETDTSRQLKATSPTCRMDILLLQAKEARVQREEFLLLRQEEQGNHQPVRAALKERSESWHNILPLLHPAAPFGCSGALRSRAQTFCGEMMMSIFRRLRVRLFPPVGKRQAALIASRAVAPNLRQFRVYGKRPPNVNLYNLPTEPCWYVFAPWHDGKDDLMLRSSRLLLVSKISGKVLYDGSANDEG